MGKHTLLDVIDAVWSVERPETEWLAGIADAAVLAVPGSHGGIAYRFEVTAAGCPIVAWGGEPGFASIPKVLDQKIDPTELKYAYGVSRSPVITPETGAQVPSNPGGKMQRPPRGTFLSRFRFSNGQLPPPVRNEYRGLGFTEGLVTVVPEGPDSGFLLGVPVPRPLTQPRGAERKTRLLQRWQPIAGQIARALQVRRTVQAGEDVIAAEVDSEGQGDFRDPGQREEVREALRRHQRARRIAASGQTGDIDDAWNALLTGRFSIVRRRQTNGRLRFVAIENDPLSQPLRQLTREERIVVERVALGDSNKAIAIDLDLHESSIANILRRAMDKLGVRERVHLARLAAAMGGPRR